MRTWITGLLVTITSTQAWAVDCQDVQGMLSAGISSEQVVQTIQLAADVWSDDQVRCLRDAGAPTPVMDAALAATPERAEQVDSPERIESVGAPTASTDDTPSALRSDLPQELSRIPALQQAGKHRAASLALTRALDDWPRHSVQIHYLLARSLAAMGLIHGAQHHYMKVVRAGPDHPQFRVAVVQLVAIAGHTGDDVELRRFAHRLPDGDVPRSVRGDLVYLRGVRAMEQRRLTEAQMLFDDVPYGTSRSQRASYLRGVVLHERGKLASAVRAFREVSNNESSAPDAHRLRQLARLNLGRVHYEVERFDTAESWYDQVDHDDPAFAQALFERAWSRFMRRDHDAALGSLLSLHSPHFRATLYHPGADLLGALTWYELCQADRVHSELARLERRYRPELVALTTFIDDHQPADALVDYEQDQPFSPQLRNTIARDRTVALAASALHRMADEREQIAHERPAWRREVGEPLLRAYAQDEARYQRRGGHALLRALRSTRQTTSKVLQSAAILRFETVDLERRHLERPSLGVMPSQAGAKTDYIVPDTPSNWQFNGEFWEDEIGRYLHVSQSTCL